jgi:NTE family protein
MDITLALGGGGARGNSHIGVLRRLVEERIRIRAVAGTSFGGLVAAFFASGFGPDEIEDIFVEVDQTKLYDRRPGEGPSLMGLSAVSQWLDEILGERSFADLKIPCALTAVDLKTGTEVILSEGIVKHAILATIAIPGIFPTYSMNGWELVDGGVLDPVPVSVARSLAPRLPVVAVSLSSPTGKPVQPWTMPLPKLFPRQIAERITRTNYARAFDIFLRSVDIGGRAVAEYRLVVDKPAVVIRPAVAHIQTLDRVDVQDVARLGYEAAEAAVPELRRVLSWPARLSRGLFRS